MRLITIAFLLLFSKISAYETSPQVDLSTDISESDSLISEQNLEYGSIYDTLFTSDFNGIDTANWCTSHINSARFDYKTLVDTLKIVLVDSSFSRFYVHPFCNYITSPFGPRGGYWHFGTDIKVQIGDTIRCALDGIVRVIQDNHRRGYGKVVVVRHHNGLETLYGHLSKIAVTPNQKIKAGELIGLGGNSGRSTGSHLHFEIRYCGEAIDPASVIDFEHYSLLSDTLKLSSANFEYLTELRKTVYHNIKKGENLGMIARHYSTTINKLCVLNGITLKTKLKVGRKLVIRKEPPPEATIILHASNTTTTRQSSE